MYSDPNSDDILPDSSPTEAAQMSDDDLGLNLYMSDSTFTDTSFNAAGETSQEQLSHSPPVKARKAGKASKARSVISEDEDFGNQFEYDCTAELTARSKSRMTPSGTSTPARTYSRTPTNTKSISSNTSNRTLTAVISPDGANSGLFSRAYSVPSPASTSTKSLTTSRPAIRPGTSAGCRTVEGTVSRPTSNKKPRDGSEKRLLQNILDTQREILGTVMRNETELKALKRKLEEKESQEPIKVPNQIKNSIREGHSSGKDRGLTWEFVNKKYGDQCNDAMRDYVNSYVIGIYPSLELSVLEAGMKRYYTSRKEDDTRQRNNQLENHRVKQRSYQRKKEKSKRRIGALASKKWDKEKKDRVERALDHNLMSSDEDEDGCLVSRPPSWESRQFAKLKSILDEQFLKICSETTRRMMSERRRGDPKEKANPKIDEDVRWIIEEDTTI